MRFGINDLMLATTLVAIYAAGFAHLSRLGGQPLRSGELVGGVIMVTTMAATTLWMARRFRKRAGTPLVAWPISNWWVTHMMFLLMFAGYLGFCTWHGTALGIIFPLVIAFQQFAFLFNRWLVLSREGVLFGLGFIPWNRCEMNLTAEDTHIEYSIRGRLLPPQWPVKKQRLAVPAEKRGEVREVLALVQPAGDSKGPA